jgi:Domain of unknown function (DUF4189)
MKMIFQKIAPKAQFFSAFLIAMLLILQPATAHAQASQEDIQRQQEEQRRNDELAAQQPPPGCPEGSKDLGTGGCLFPRPPAYAVIASHPDANDIWVAAMYPDRDSAWNAAMRQCGNAMGAGCEWGWTVNNGPIGAALGANGTVHWAVGRDKKAVQKSLDAMCKDYELGCTPIGFFNGRSEFRGRRKYKDDDNIRFPKDVNSVRKTYAASSWMTGGSYDGKSWVASGYSTQKEAEDVALNACYIKNNNNSSCQVVVATGNGVVAFYNTGESDSVIVEQNEARARQAIEKRCKRLNRKCTINGIYDARSSGVFENGSP